MDTVSMRLFDELLLRDLRAARRFGGGVLVLPPLKLLRQLFPNVPEEEMRWAARDVAAAQGFDGFVFSGGV